MNEMDWKVSLKQLGEQVLHSSQECFQDTWIIDSTRSRLQLPLQFILVGNLRKEFQANKFLEGSQKSLDLKVKRHRQPEKISSYLEFLKFRFHEIIKYFRPSETWWKVFKLKNLILDFFHLFHGPRLKLKSTSPKHFWATFKVHFWNK